MSGNENTKWSDIMRIQSSGNGGLNQLRNIIKTFDYNDEKKVYVLSVGAK